MGAVNPYSMGTYCIVSTEKLEENKHEQHWGNSPQIQSKHSKHMLSTYKQQG